MIPVPGVVVLLVSGVQIPWLNLLFLPGCDPGYTSVHSLLNKVKGKVTKVTDCSFLLVFA